MKRLHQIQTEQIIDSIIAGSPVRKIVCHVTPGGGKSALPIIAGKLIEAGLADALCWICPRSALQDQGERNFLDPFFRQMLGHNLTIRSSTNELSPCRGQNGFITTYQALGVDNDSTVLREFGHRRYILVLDEFHHLEIDGLWTNSLRDIVQRARYGLFMSGTLERGDGKRIAFIPYTEEVGQSGRVFRPDPAAEPGTAYIQYTRTDALRERAILPILFKLSDGRVSWEKDGRRREGRLSHRIGDASQALFTALSTDFADHLLKDGVQHWLKWKATHPRSKLMVVTANFEHAKRFTKALDGMGIRAKIATSHDSPEAFANIKAFKADLDCLVCVAMCYEGLDVPAMTHIIALTHVRSVPWIEQMIARAVRVDRQAGPYSSQKAFVFAPDDFLFREVVEQIRAEQLATVHEAESTNEKQGGNGNGGKGPGIDPLAGEITDTREISLGETPDSVILPPPMTIHEQEDEARARIEAHVKEFCHVNRYKIVRINTEIKAVFGKKRELMTLRELKNCLRWIERNYPVRSKSPVFLADGISRTRGCGKRVPTKAQPWSLPLFQEGE